MRLLIKFNDPTPVISLPKYRHEVFSEPCREAVKTIIHKIGFDYDIYMVVRSELKISPSQIMQVVKSISGRVFFKLFPDIKRRYFWGDKLWTQSYHVETIGNATEEAIRKYVQNQLVKLDKKEVHGSQLGLC